MRVRVVEMKRQPDVTFESQADIIGQPGDTIYSIPLAHKQAERMRYAGGIRPSHEAR